MKFEYDEEFASYFIHNRLSEPIAERLESEDIRIILQLEWEFLEALEHSEEAENLASLEINEDDLHYFIIYHAVKYHIYLSYTELEEIINLELDYIREYGLIETDEVTS